MFRSLGTSCTVCRPCCPPTVTGVVAPSPFSSFWLSPLSTLVVPSVLQTVAVVPGPTTTAGKSTTGIGSDGFDDRLIGIVSNPWVTPAAADTETVAVAVPFATDAVPAAGLNVMPLGGC